jgi:very-short-patch-repair endonuclease
VADDYPVGGYKVDVGFLDRKVAIGVDGWAFHSDADNIALLGWEILRLTWLDLTEYPQHAIS